MSSAAPPIYVPFSATSLPRDSGGKQDILCWAEVCRMDGSQDTEMNEGATWRKKKNTLLLIYSQDMCYWSSKLSFSCLYKDLNMRPFSCGGRVVHAVLYRAGTGPPCSRSHLVLQLALPNIGNSRRGVELHPSLPLQKTTFSNYFGEPLSGMETLWVWGNVLLFSVCYFIAQLESDGFNSLPRKATADSGIALLSLFLAAVLHALPSLTSVYVLKGCFHLQVSQIYFQKPK